MPAIMIEMVPKKAVISNPASGDDWLGAIIPPVGGCSWKRIRNKIEWGIEAAKAECKIAKNEKPVEKSELSFVHGKFYPFMFPISG